LVSFCAGRTFRDLISFLVVVHHRLTTPFDSTSFEKMPTSITVEYSNPQESFDVRKVSTLLPFRSQTQVKFVYCSLLGAEAKQAIEERYE